MHGLILSVTYQGGAYIWPTLCMWWRNYERIVKTSFRVSSLTRAILRRQETLNSHHITWRCINVARWDVIPMTVCCCSWADAAASSHCRLPCRVDHTWHRSPKLSIKLTASVVKCFDSWEKFRCSWSFSTLFQFANTLCSNEMYATLVST